MSDLRPAITKLCQEGHRQCDIVRLLKVPNKLSLMLSNGFKRQVAIKKTDTETEDEPLPTLPRTGEKFAKNVPLQRP